MVAVRVYVEGGGDTTDQQKRLRIALKTWILAAVPGSERVTVVACGGRKQAYDDFCLAVSTHRDDFCILLVDSEEKVTRTSRWAHIKHRTGDGWDAPGGTDDENLHFMAQTMEAWLCSDPEALGEWFGRDFKPDKLPKRPNLEDEGKADLNRKLETATKDSRKGAYHKGRDLGLLDEVAPDKVRARCRHAGIFAEAVRSRL